METSYVSSVIDAPVDEVWTHLRDFGGVASYYSAVKSATIADGKSGDVVGCERVVVLQDGSTVRERLLALSDKDYSTSYALLSEGLPLTNYIATVRLKPITDGAKTFIEWSSTYEIINGDVVGVHELVERDIYLAAMRGLQKLLGARDGPTAGDRRV
jgi:hypothetical protein